jgi:hypothetical protein
VTQAATTSIAKLARAASTKSAACEYAADRTALLRAMWANHNPDGSFLS